MDLAKLDDPPFTGIPAATEDGRRRRDCHCVVHDTFSFTVTYISGRNTSSGLFTSTKLTGLTDMLTYEYVHCSFLFSEKLMRSGLPKAVLILGLRRNPFLDLAHPGGGRLLLCPYSEPT
jgi:hypothetical protein